MYRRTIDEVTYKQQKDRLDQEIALAEMAAHDAKLDELDVEAVVVFAEHVLLNAARLWQEFSLGQKQRLQQLLFPVGRDLRRRGIPNRRDVAHFPHVARSRRRARESEVSPMVPSWNQLLGWLRDVDLLRKVGAA